MSCSSGGPAPRLRPSLAGLGGVPWVGQRSGQEREVIGTGPALLSVSAPKTLERPQGEGDFTGRAPGIPQGQLHCPQGPRLPRPQGVCPHVFESSLMAIDGKCQNLLSRQGSLALVFIGLFVFLLSSNSSLQMLDPMCGLGCPHSVMRSQVGSHSSKRPWPWTQALTRLPDREKHDVIVQVPCDPATH